MNHFTVSTNHGSDLQGLWLNLRVSPPTQPTIIQRFRWIPLGTFLMGSSKAQPDSYPDEKPQHKVVFAKGFWLADTTCTQVLWQVVMGENPSHFKGPERPVERVSWQDVQDFLTKINAQIPGLELSLPSEAQWEYACRAGTETPFSFGANITPDQANYDDSEYPYVESTQDEYHNETMPVKSLPANPWGLYEMHGNVWEWTQNAWHDNYENAPSDGSAQEASNTGTVRVWRGGSWLNSARNCRCACRNGGEPGNRGSILGFRCAATAIV